MGVSPRAHRQTGFLLRCAVKKKCVSSRYFTSSVCQNNRDSRGRERAAAAAASLQLSRTKVEQSKLVSSMPPYLRLPTPRGARAAWSPQFYPPEARCPLQQRSVFNVAAYSLFWVSCTVDLPSWASPSH